MADAPEHVLALGPAGRDAPESLRGGRYAVTRLLGEGGQAATFEAVDKQGGKLVAIKRFRVKGAKSWKEVELAEREARVLASLAHPSLPRYVEHFEEDGELFLVTEMIEGESLAALRKKGETLSEADVVRLLRDASSALDYLHRRPSPIVHRDLKPSNVLRRPDGSFAFIDFGAVRDRMKPEGGSTVVGTFGFMAPEQFQGRAMPASDVYGVGATALTLLTGVEPEDQPHRGLAIDVAAALRGGATSAGLAAALRAMLEPDPDERAPRIAPLLEGIGRGEHGERERKSRADARSDVRADLRDRREARADRHERRRAEHALRHEQRAQRRDEKALRRAMAREVRWEARRRRGVPWFVALLFTVGSPSRRAR